MSLPKCGGVVLWGHSALWVCHSMVWAYQYHAENAFSLLHAYGIERKKVYVK